MNRKFLIKFFTFLGGIYFVLEFFLPKKIGDFQFGLYHEEISLGFLTVGAAAAGLGLINILLVHGNKIIFRKENWFNSAALIIGLFTMMLVTFWHWYGSVYATKAAENYGMLSMFAADIAKDSRLNSDRITLLKDQSKSLLEQTKHLFESDTTQKNTRYQSIIHKLSQKIELAEESLVDLDSKENLSAFSKTLEAAGSSYRAALNYNFESATINKIYNLLYEGFFVALGAAMFSLLAFYVASAAYRAFRIKTLESALMMLAALLVMLGQIPFGLWISDSLPAIRLWLLEVPNSGAFRAIAIGSGVAGLIMAFRMWLSIESESFDE